MKKIRLILLAVPAVLPIFLIISVALYTAAHTLFIFPSEKYNSIGWWPHANEQSSIHLLNTTTREIEFEYTLNGNPAYAGFSLFLDKDYPFLDLSKYTEVTVKISASEAKHFGLIIQTFEKGITKLVDGNYTPLRYCQNRKRILKNSDTYTIPLSALEVPDWWIDLYALRGKELDRNPLKNSAVLQIFFDDRELLGQKQRVELYEISFHSASGTLWWLIAGGTVCYYVLFGSILILPRVRKKLGNNQTKLLSSYRRISEKNSWQKDAETVRSYVSEHYNHPDISLKLVSHELTMTEKRINDIIRREYAMSFKACIVWLRLQEAKRLLIETGLNITEIAFGLGFSSNSYFCLIFKKHVGLTPREYREKYGPTQ